MNLQILKKNSSKGFKFLTGLNRDIIPSQVTKLANSIEKMGVIRPIVVATIGFLDERGTYVIDGQHLFYALMRADMDIPYVTIEVSNKADLVEKIALLNASSKSWAMTDYLTAWSHVSSEYRKLQEYYNVYDFELCFLAATLGNYCSARSGNGGASIKIKKGQFKIHEEGDKVVFLDRLTELLQIIPRMNRVENLYLCNEYAKFYKEIGKAYNHNVFMEAVKKKKSQLSLATQENGKLVEMFKKLI